MVIQNKNISEAEDYENLMVPTENRPYLPVPAIDGVGIKPMNILESPSVWSATFRIEAGHTLPVRKNSGLTELMIVRGKGRYASGDSIASDPSRDYATLLSAGIEAPLRILSGLTLPSPVPQNVEQISGSFHGIAITDLVLRDIYRRAAVVTVPLLDVLQPTGYSVTLQAMACGKPVVISDFRGLWDRDAFVSGENCMLVPHGDPAALRDAVETLLADADLRARMGAAARATAESAFPLARMDDSIRQLVATAAPDKAEAA